MLSAVLGMIMSIKTILNFALNTSDLNEKLKLSRLYCHLITGSKELVYDAIKYEIDISKHFIPLVADIHLNHNLISTKSSLHIISEAYLSGGHTRLCENLASMDFISPDLLISREAKELVINRLESHFVNVFYINNNDECERIKSIFLKVIEYENVVLHIHPDDILVTIALNLAKKFVPTLKVYFVNHADHLFSFGKSVADCVFQISYRGYEIDNLISDKHYENSFLGIPILLQAKQIKLKVGSKVIIAGASYKMKPRPGINLPSQLAKFLKINQSHTVKIIGVGSLDYWWWSLKLLFPFRVNLYGEMSYSSYVQTISESDICIDTAPITGGTAFVEMFANSLYPMALKSGIYGYTPLDQIRVDDLTCFKVYSDEYLNKLYDDVLSVHSFDNVGKRYNAALKGNYQEIPLTLTKYKNDMSLFVREKKVKLTALILKDIIEIESFSLHEKFLLIFNEFSFFDAFTRKLIRHIKFRRGELN
jgi:hypothetical protein